MCVWLGQSNHYGELLGLVRALVTLNEIIVAVTDSPVTLQTALPPGS